MSELKMIFVDVAVNKTIKVYRADDVDKRIKELERKLLESPVHENEVLKGRLNRAEAQLETKDLQLAACSVVAHANTRESAKYSRDMLPEYRCASVEDVERAVDKQMDYREQLDKVLGLKRFDIDMDDESVRYRQREYRDDGDYVDAYTLTAALNGEDDG